MTLKYVRIMCSAAALLTLVACGGEDGSTSSTASAEGTYGGALTGSSSTAFQMLVLENDEFWVLYGTQLTSAFAVAGFIQGQGTSASGKFSAPAARDYGVFPAAAGSANANYDASAKTVSGSASFPGRTVNFTGGPIAGSLYNYNSPAALSAVSGSWSVTVNTGESAIVSISSTGAMTVSSSGGCSSTGTVTPRASGKNVFNVSLTFGAAPCLLPRTTVTGIAISYPLASGRTQLIAGARDGSQSAGFMVFGTR